MTYIRGLTVFGSIYSDPGSVDTFARTHGCVRNDSEKHETVLLNPATPVKCLSLSFRTHPCILAFITYIQMELRWLLSNEFDAKKINHSYMFFKFAICSIALLSLGETWHLMGRGMVTVWQTVLLLSCYDCDSTHQHYDVMWFECVLWHRTMHEWVMNIHYQTWYAQGRLINIIRTLSKQWGVCDKFLYHTSADIVPHLCAEHSFHKKSMSSWSNSCKHMLLSCEK